MNAVALRFYVHQPRKHGKALLFEWLLEQAKQLGIHGGSAFFATAGYGRHGVIHEQRFFELPEVEMANSTSPSRPSASTWRAKT